MMRTDGSGKLTWDVVSQILLSVRTNIKVITKVSLVGVGGGDVRCYYGCRQS